MTNKEQINGLYELKQYLMENPIELQGHKSLPITLIDYAIKALEGGTQGEWVSETNGKMATLDEFGNVSCSVHCSKCGDWLTASDEYGCRGRYCPNCGAKMEGDME